MKNLLVVFTVVALILGGSGTVAAVTFIFDPNDLIDKYDQGPPLDTPDPANPRSVYTGGAGAYPGYQGIGDWNTQGYGSARDLAVNTDYLGWRDTKNGFITAFNIWLADNPRARGWGETLVIKPNTGLSATTASGWSVEVSTNEWHSDLYYAEWTADDVTKALEIGGPDIGEFSFTATLYVDENENGWDASDPLAQVGQDYTIWFGGYGVGDDSYPYGTAVYGTSNFGEGAILYQGTLDLTAIPEPASILVWSLLSLVCVGAYRWRRRSGSVEFGGSRRASRQPARRPWAEGTTDAILEIIERGRMI